MPFVDAQGRSVDHRLNRLMVAVPLGALARVGEVVVAYGGRAKAAALAAAMRALRVHMLVTDEAAAAALVGS